MTARPGGHLGVAAWICALGVALSAGRQLSSAPLGPRAGAPSEVRTLLEPLRHLDLAAASSRSLDSADDPDDDPAAEAAQRLFEPCLPPAELPGGARRKQPVDVPPPAPMPRGPPGSL